MTKLLNKRQLRVGEQIRHVLADSILHDCVPLPKNTSVTITEVRVSPDLRHGLAFILPLMGKDSKAVLKIFNESRGALQHEIAKNMCLKYVPKLRFVLDESFDQADHIESLLTDL